MADAVAESFHFDDDGEPAYISLTVRTLSGSELQFPQLGLDMTVGELKQLISEQNEAFPVEQQKLIKGSKTLENQETLGDYGLKNGDTIHLVKRLGDDAEEDTGPEVKISRTAPGQSDTLSVVVPANARPGTRLLINPPGREQMAVVVPPRMRPGMRFQVRIPPRPASSNSGSSGGGGSGMPGVGGSSQSSSASSGSIMQVRCPPGVRAGANILIEVPGRGRMRVQVPNGVNPGENFRFRIP